MQTTLKKWQVFFENAATFLFWGKLFFVFYILHLSHRCVLLISNSKQLTFISNFIESSQNGFFQDCSGRCISSFIFGHSEFIGFCIFKTMADSHFCDSFNLFVDVFYFYLDSGCGNLSLLGNTSK